MLVALITEPSGQILPVGKTIVLVMPRVLGNGWAE